MTMTMERPDTTVRIEVLGAELRRLREACGLTLVEASKRVGISMSQLSRLETGVRAQRLEDVASLCTVYEFFGYPRPALLHFTRPSPELGFRRKPKECSFTPRVVPLRM